MDFFEKNIVAILAIIITTVTGWWWFRWSAHRDILTDKPSRDDKLAELTAKDFKTGYERRLGRGLEWLDGRFGEGRFAWRGFGLCFAIAVLYTLVFFIVGWGAGGPGTLGRVELLELVDPPRAQPFLAGGMLLAWSLCGLIAWKAREIDQATIAWLARRLPSSLAPRSRLVYGAVGTLVMGAIVFLGKSGAGADIAFAFAFTFAFAFAFGVAVTFGVAFAGVVAVAVTATVVAAVASASASAVAVASAVIIDFLKGVDDPAAGSMILFFFLLPAANGALDYVSLNISRWLGRRLVAARSAWVIAWHSAADLLAAAALLGTLAFVLPFVVESYNLTIEGLGGQRPLDLASLLDRALTGENWGDRVWVAAMLFSTLLPTVVHLAVLLGGVFTLITFTNWREQTIAILESPEPNAADLDRAARYLSFRWGPGIMAACAAIAGFGGLVALVLWVLADVSIAGALHGVALSGIGFAGWLFGGPSGGDLRGFQPTTPYGISTVEPVVRRACMSRWALAASFRA